MIRLFLTAMGLVTLSLSVAKADDEKRDTRPAVNPHKTEEASNGGRSGGGLFLNGEFVGVYWGSYTSNSDSEKDTTDRGNGMATSCIAVCNALEGLGLSEIIK